MFSWLIVAQVQAMYFANPPVMPSLDFYREAFELLMKYEDLWVLKKTVLY